LHVRFVIWASNRGGWYDVRSRVMEAVAREFRDQKVALGFQRVEVENAEHDEQGAAASGAAINQPPVR
jgi:small-conductance mechanosensitive channel